MRLSRGVLYFVLTFAFLVGHAADARRPPNCFSYSFRTFARPIVWDPGDADDVVHDPLLEAVQHSDVRRVEQLLAAGHPVDVTGGWSGATALHYAARSGNFAIARLLVRQGAYVNALSRGFSVDNPYDFEHFCTPLRYALDARERRMADFLVRHGARVGFQDAVDLGDTATADKFLRDDPSVLEQEGPTSILTPLQRAIDNGDEAMIRFLIARGANLFGLTDEAIALPSPFEYAAAGYLNADLLEAMLVRAATPGGVNPAALQDAIAAGSPELVERLLAVGSRVEGTTDALLKQAEERRDWAESDRRQIEEDASRSLDTAYRYDHDDIVAQLLKHGAAVNASDEEGETLLHTAVRREDPATVSLLLEHGADRNVKNTDGDTPLDVARERESREIIELLQ